MVDAFSIADWHYEHDGQRKRTKYTVPRVDKGTSLHCYYVKRWICMWHLFYTFLHNSSEGMFLCVPEELYILSAFFVSDVHSVRRRDACAVHLKWRHTLQSKLSTCKSKSPYYSTLKNVPLDLHVTCKTDVDADFSSAPPPPLPNFCSHYVTAPGMWAPWNVCPPPPSPKLLPARLHSCILFPPPPPPFSVI